MKGVSEILMPKCTRHVIVHRDGADDIPGETAQIGELEEDIYRGNPQSVIQVHHRNLLLAS